MELRWMKYRISQETAQPQTPLEENVFSIVFDKLWSRSSRRIFSADTTLYSSFGNFPAPAFLSTPRAGCSV